LRAINGLNRPRQGSIHFEGRDITTSPPHQIVAGGIAQSPEGRRLFPRMSVTENLEMGAFQRTDKENFQADMDRVFELFPRLYERRMQKAGTMSGGEQQMCAIGRALMARPKLLLLDEPSMGLAPIFVEKIFEIVVEINSQGTPVLLVEQNALMALDTAHRGYVMETGRITIEGRASDLKNNEAVQKAYLGLD
jgi:branched-chain amino acid transport system ATP-binding protein